MGARTQRTHGVKSEGGSWFAIVFGAGLLVVMGFVLGIVAGAVWEERQLIANHLLGNAEQITLAEAEPESAPQASQRAPLDLGGGREEESQTSASPSISEESGGKQVVATPKKELFARSAVPAPAVSAPPPEGQYQIQVGAFVDRAPAEQLAAHLRKKGYSSNLSQQRLEGGGDGRWRVRVGPTATRAEAEFLAAKLKREEKLPTWILSHESS